MTCHPVKKKKPSAKTTKVSTSVPASPSASTHFASTSLDSSVQALEGNFDFPDFERSDSGARPSEPEPEPITLNVINKPKMEDNMATDLRAGFKERHHKHFHKAIEVAAPPTKRACLKGVQEEPMRDVIPGPMPPSDAMGLSSMPAVEKEISTVPNGAPSGVAPVNEVLDQKDTPASAPPPSWDEMMEMLRWVLCFTDVESSSTKMLDFFPLTKRISMNLGGEPPVFVSAQLFLGMPESVISRI